MPTTVSCKLFVSMSPQTKEKISLMSRVSYANTVGCLMYGVVCTRLGIPHVVSVMSRFMASPGIEYRQRVKRIFRYPRGTTDIGLVYSNDKECLVT